MHSAILNVSSDENRRDSRGLLLTCAGFEVLAATDGRSALELAREGSDLVLLDIGLPDMSGFDVCRAIKTDRVTAQTRVVLVSETFVGNADRVRGLDGGADSFLVEPAEPEVLIATVNALLRARHSEIRLAASVRLWQAMFDAIGDGIASVDAAGRVVRCNEAFARILRPPGGPIGSGWRDLFPRWRGQERFESQIGDHWFEVRRYPFSLQDDRRDDSVWVLTDVTERRQALYRQCQAREVAEQANRRKGELMASLAHDLRNALNVVAGWTQVIREQSSAADKTRAFLDVIERKTQLQARLISDMLDLSHKSSVSVAEPQDEAPMPVVRSVRSGEDKNGDERINVACLPVSGDIMDFPLPHSISLGHKAIEGVRVLVVDDSSDILELSVATFKLEGAQVRTAPSSAQALAVMAEWRPDVVIADIGMPVEDGYVFIDKLRRLPKEAGGNVPALAWTGYAKEEDRLRTLRAGYQAHVSRPTSVEELVWAVANLAGRA